MNPNVPQYGQYFQVLVASALALALVLVLHHRQRLKYWLTYWRIDLFRKILNVVQPGTRSIRMRAFEALFGLTPGTRIIDLGGTAEIWGLVPTPLDITIVNLPGVPVNADVRSHHRFTFLEGDATKLVQFADNSFDIVFSNSVIEHVGDATNRARFASEVQRLAKRYYVQTPCKQFPVEVHTGIPFWWYLPRAFRDRMHRKWAVTLPLWNEMVMGTTVLSKAEFQGLFPDSTLRTERLLGIPKSYFVVRC